MSDFPTLSGEPLPPSNLEKYEEQNDEHFHGSNDIFVGEDEEMDEFNYEGSDDELVAESSDIQPKVEDGDIGSILIGLKEVRLRYKVMLMESDVVLIIITLNWKMWMTTEVIFKNSMLLNEICQNTN